MNNIIFLPEWIYNWAEPIKYEIENLSHNEFNSLKEWAFASEKMGIHYLIDWDNVSLKEILESLKISKNINIHHNVEQDKPNNFKVILELDGFKLVRLNNDKSLYGEKLSTVNTDMYFYDYLEDQVLSVRDANNISHCTMVFNKENNSIKNILGVDGLDVEERYHSVVKSFIEMLEPSIIHEAKRIGCFVVGERDYVTSDILDKNYYSRTTLLHMNNLPKGLTIEGKLFFIGHPIEHLPENLTVNGNLIIIRCHNLHKIPSGLSVNGDLHIINCDKLHTMETDLYVKREALILNCPSFELFSDVSSIGLSLCIGECDSIKNIQSLIKFKDKNSKLSLEFCTNLKKINLKNIQGNVEIKLPDSLINQLKY